MHQHDQELIMALVEGTLDETVAAAARTEIEGCPECARDLELQSFALSALDSLPDAALTEFESAKLRRDVRSELGVFKEEVKFEPTKKQRRFPLAAFATAAAVLVAVVAIAPRLSLVGGDSADDVALNTFAPAETTLAPSFDAAGGEAPQATEELAATTAAPTAGAFTTTTAAPVPTRADGLLGYYAESPDLAVLRMRLESGGFEPDLAREFALKDAGDGVAEEDVATVGNCLVTTLANSDEFEEGFQFARGNYDGREVIFYVYLAEEPADSAVVVQAADTCEELARAGP